MNSANNKEKILWQIITLAPEMKSHTRVVVLADIPADTFAQNHIDELKSNMIGSALYVISEGKSSGYGSLCSEIDNCRPFQDWKGHLVDTMVFLLDEHLNLELIEYPGRLIDAFDELDYDVSELYDPDAPLPSRAYTMLGLSPE